MKKIITTTLLGLGILFNASNAEAERINIKNNGSTFTIDLDDNDKTVADLKKKIEKEKGIPVSSQQILWQGGELIDTALLDIPGFIRLNGPHLVEKKVNSQPEAQNLSEQIVEKDNGPHLIENNVKSKTEAQELQEQLVEIDKQIDDLLDKFKASQNQIRDSNNKIRDLQTQIRDAQNQTRYSQNKVTELRNKKRYIERQIARKPR